MEGLLTPVSTTYKTGEKETEDALVEVPKAPESRSKLLSHATTPIEALEVIRNEPDHDSLISALKYLTQSGQHFDITKPSAVAAQLVHTLVSDTVPNYWNILKDSEVGSKKNSKQSWRHSSELRLLLLCLRSVTGLNAILLSLKQHIQKSKESKKAVGGPKVEDVLAINLDLLQTLLEGDRIVLTIWNSICKTSDTQSKQKAVWSEFLGLVGTGKLLGVVAEAEDVVNDLRKKIGKRHWVADGTLYSVWLSLNITKWIKSLALDAENGWKNCSELLSKSLRLGHTGELRIKPSIFSRKLTFGRRYNQGTFDVSTLPEGRVHFPIIEAS